MERTVVLLKPDAVQRGLIGRILARFEDKGLRIVGLKMVWLDRAAAERLYQMHRGKQFYEPLIRFMTASPSVAVALEGPSAVSVVRLMLGATAGTEAAAGTIRGDYGLSGRLNLAHASDSPENAARELAALFDEAELFDYRLTSNEWVVRT